MPEIHILCIYWNNPLIFSCRWRLLDRPGDSLVWSLDRGDAEPLQKALEHLPPQPKLRGAVLLVRHLDGTIAVDRFQELLMPREHTRPVVLAAVDGAGRRARRGSIADQPTQIVSELIAPLIGKS